MRLADVMEEVAARLGSIDGLRVFPHPADSVSPPAAIVSYPETLTYDETYGRGFDRMTLPVVVVVGKPYDRSTRDLITRYTDGSGGSSVKAALEAGTYASCDGIRVTGVEFDVVSIAGTDYVAAQFDLDIAGSGS
jgi:hypothetical protein